jgi:uncharacterized protein (TIRG00374 family)
MKALSKSIRVGLGVAVSVACAWLAFRRVPLVGLGQHFRGMRAWWIAPAVAAQLLAVVARAWRWVVLLRVRGRLGDAFFAQGLGYMFTNLFPFRLGEPVRVLAMAQRCQAPVLEVATTAVLERLMDVATMLVVLASLLFVLPVSPAWSRVGIFFSVACAGGLCALFASVFFQDDVERLLRRLVAAMGAVAAGDRVARRWRELVRGVRPLMSARVAMASVALSGLTWTFSIAMYWFVMLAFQPAATPVEAAFLVVALAFAVSVPSSPGFVGVFHLVAQQTLTSQFASKYDVATALSIALASHLVYFVTTTTLGIAGAWRFRGSLSEWRRDATS